MTCTYLFHISAVHAITLLSIICISQINAQSISKLLGAKAAGMAYAASVTQNEWAVFNNIAGLAASKEFGAAASYELRPDLASGSRFGALVCSPFSFGVLGLGAFRFGDDVYSEQLLSLGFANKIGNTSLGARVSYIQYKAEGFGTHTTIGVDFGGITKLTKQLSIGAWIQNLNKPKLNNGNGETAPIKLFAALGFTPTEKFTVITEMEKDILYPAIWKSGMEYGINKKFFVRAGININPNAFFAGVGFDSWRIKIDYSIQSLSSLSTSHQASAFYRISKIKSKE